MPNLKEDQRVIAIGFHRFSEKLFEASANIWIKKICFGKAVQKEDYGTDMREWISKLILINEIDVAEDLLKKLKRKLTILIFISRTCRLSCSTADFKNNYAKELYDKALEKAGDDMYDLEALIVSVS